jgi:hypothetical protein
VAAIQVVVVGDGEWESGLGVAPGRAGFFVSVSLGDCGEKCFCDACDWLIRRLFENQVVSEHLL